MSSRKFVRRTRLIHQSLAADLGTGLEAATTRGSKAWVETHAVARAIAAAWGTNERLSYLWDPWRCSMRILERWEKILALTPSPDDIDFIRRRRVARLLVRHGRPASPAELAEILAEELGSAFLSVESIGVSIAQITVPDGSYPIGTPNVDQPWSSTVARVLVRLHFAAHLTPAECLDIVARLVVLLDPVLPAWATIGWYATGPVSVDVPDGPHGAGFFLDQARNLDAAIFSE